MTRIPPTLHEDEELPAPSYVLGQGLLDYALTSTPYPLMASPESPGALTRADLTLVICAAPDERVLCRELMVELPLGDQAQALVSSAEGINVDLRDSFWTVKVETVGDRVRITLSAHGSGYVFDEDGLLVRLQNLGIARSIGGTWIEVVENAEPYGSAPGARAAARVRLDLVKDPYEPPLDAGSPNRFSVHRYSGSGADTAPATLVAAGRPVTLRWQYRQGVTRHLFGDFLPANAGPYDPLKGLDVTDLTRLDSDPLLRAAVFTLRTKDTTTGQITDESVTVQVDSPTYAGLTLTGPLTPRGEAVEFDITGSFSVRGALRVEGTLATVALQAPRGATASGPLQALGGGAVTDALTTGGRLRTDGEVATGHVTTGDLTARGRVQMFGTPEQARITLNMRRSPQTDGLYAGQLSPSPHNNRTEVEVTAASAGDTDVRRTAVDIDNRQEHGALFLPLLRGDTVQARGYAANPGYGVQNMFWIPFGKGGFPQVSG